MNTRFPSIPLPRPESAIRSSGYGLPLFFTLTLGWMGICGGLAILVARGPLTVPLPFLALISLGGLMPLLAALVAAGYETGSAGIRTLLAQLARKRLVGAGRWSAVALLGMALIMLLALALARMRNGALPPLPPATTWQTLPLLAVVYLSIALIEEVGWRGYALPRLQARYGALVASLLLGLIWGLWHLPQWLIPATGQADKWPFSIFLLHTVAFSILLTWLYNRNAGTLWSVILAHAAFNLYPEPWAAAWQTLPVDQRGIYPVILITMIEVALAVVIAQRWLSLKSLGAALAAICLCSCVIQPIQPGATLLAAPTAVPSPIATLAATTPPVMGLLLPWAVLVLVVVPQLTYPLAVLRISMCVFKATAV